MIFQAAAAAKAAVQSLSRRLVPLFDRVVVEKAEAVTRTKGGIVIPEKATNKVLQGTIVAVGPGARNEVIIGFFSVCIEAFLEGGHVCRQFYRIVMVGKIRVSKGSAEVKLLDTELYGSYQENH